MTHSSTETTLRRLGRSLLAMGALALLPLLGWGQVSLTGTSPTYSQDFNTLISTGSGTFAQNSTITGVYAQRSGTGTTIAADNGSGTGGNLYSYGTTSATERALGSIGSSNAAAGGFAYGIQFQNNTASAVTSITLSYNGEEWRNGGTNAVQVVDFSYQVSTSAITSLAPSGTALASGTTTGTTPTGYTAVSALNFSSPVNSTTAGALDGNAAANRATISATFSVNVPVGSYLMLRWGDPDHNGSDNGLSIDDVSATFTLAAPPATSITTGDPSGTPVCASSAATITVPFTTTGTLTGTYAVQLSDASGSFASPATLATTGSSTPLTATVPAGTASGTGYKVRVVNSSPATTGSANPTAFTIVSNPTVSIAPTTTQNIAVNTNGTTLTATETPAAASRQWVSATTSGGPYSAISGATATTYTPNFATPGTYYVAVQSTFAACGTVTSNEVQVNVTPAPALTATPNALSGFSTTVGSPSTAQSYTLTGSNVTAAVTVAAPTGYAVSLDNTTYAGSVSVPAASVNGSGQVIYVRLTGASVGSPGGNVTNATTGATTVNVAVSGTVAAAPVLAVSPTSLSGFNTRAGNASAAQNYTLTGSNLTANVIVTAPTGYELSQDGGATYATTQTVIPSGGSVNTSIAVRLMASASAGAVSGNVSNTSTGATTRNVAVSGTVVGKPTGTPSISSVSTTFNSATINLTAADGTNLLVVVRPSGSTATAPTDGTAYTANTAYGSGGPLGSGFVVFAAANAASVTVTNLNASTTYVVDVYTYNVGTVAGFENYGLNSGTATFTTTVQPQAAAGQLALEENFDYPAGTVLVASGTAGTADPTTGWYQNGSSVVNPITTSSGNLGTASQQYPRGVQSASPAGTSSQVPLTTNGQDIFKFLTQPTGATASYGAALVTVSAVQTGDYFMHFTAGAITGSATNFRARVYAKAVSGSTTTFNFGIGVSNETATYGTAAYTLGATYLVVFKYENSTATGGFDAATLFALDPTVVPTTEPATQAAGLAVPTVTTATVGNVQTNINAVGLRQGTTNAAPTVVVDNLRVGSGWGSAVGRVVYSSGTSTVVAGDYFSLTVSGSGTVATVSTTGPGNGVTAASYVVVEKRLNLNGGQVAVPNTTMTNPNPLLLRNRGLGDSFEILADGGTSYVDGPVSRETVGGPSLLFPIGRNGNYRPLTLNINSAPSGTTIYTAVQTDASAYSADGTVIAPLIRVSQIRYFSVVPNPVPAANAFTGSITLSFGSDDQVTDPSQATFVVAKSDGQGWTSIGRQGNSSNSLTSNSFADFSFFSLASTAPAMANNPLPVELTAFTAARAAKGVTLAWTTASEKNSAYFEVERSLDGQKFETVGRVQAAGSTTQTQTYRSLDAEAPAALLYYRLRMVDQDSKVAYSSTVTVAAGGAGELTLSPNPTHDQLNVLTERATAYVVRTPLGQVVLSGTTAAGTATTLDVSQLASGVYFFELPGAGRTVRRFVKE